MPKKPTAAAAKKTVSKKTTGIKKADKPLSKKSSAKADKPLSKKASAAADKGGALPKKLSARASAALPKRASVGSTNSKKGGKTLDLCLILDCTASMGAWIQRSKETLKDIIDKVKADNPDLRVRVAFVGYRDFGDRE